MARAENNPFLRAEFKDKDHADYSFSPCRVRGANQPLYGYLAIDNSLQLVICAKSEI